MTGSCVDAVISGQGDWPQDIKLDRFTYNHLGGLGELYAGPRMTDWPAKWFVGWLGRQKKYSPQPYEQCAKVLREAGQPHKANAVLYAGMERERTESAQGIRKLWLGMSRALIGYGLGYRYWRAVAWAVLGLLVGGVVFSSVGHAWAANPYRCLGYSLDHLLPLIRLAEDNYTQITLSGWQRYYFYFHELAGWFLTFFVVAGLTGLTRR